MEHCRCRKACIPRTRAGEISDTVEFPPKTFNMSKMSSTDATINAAHDLIHAVYNPSPDIPLLTLGNSHKEELISLAEIFGKSTSPAVPPRVPVRGAFQEKIQQVNKEETQIKNSF